MISFEQHKMDAFTKQVVKSLVDKDFCFEYMVNSLYRNEAPKILKWIKKAGYLSAKGEPTMFSKRNNLLYFFWREGFGPGRVVFTNSRAFKIIMHHYKLENQCPCKNR